MVLKENSKCPIVNYFIFLRAIQIENLGPTTAHMNFTSYHKIVTSKSY